MGGISAAATAGMAAKNIIDENSMARRQTKEIKRQQGLDTINRRNLLDEQLASRRARLGALGLADSSSSAKVSERMVRDSYNEEAISNQNYAKDISDIDYNKRRRREGYLLGGAGTSYDKLIK